MIEGALVPSLSSLPFPSYLPEEIKWAINHRYHLDPDGWYQREGLTHLPQSLQWKISKSLHEACHLGRDDLSHTVSSVFSGKGLYNVVNKVTSSCPTCLTNNPQGTKPPLLALPAQRHRTYPGEDRQMDCRMVPPYWGYKYIFLFVDTFTSWVEAFPTTTEKASEVAEKLLTEIIPRFGLQSSFQSDNSPAFIAQITQQISKALDIEYHLHSSWRPQSSGKVERANQHLKNTLRKITQETSFSWKEALLIALLRIGTAPKALLNLSPYEMLYGKPFLRGDLLMDSDTSAITSYVTSLGQFQQTLQKYDIRKLPSPESAPCLYCPGTHVLIKTWKDGSLGSQIQPTWKGPYPVLLSSPTAVKVPGITSWIHHSWVKPWTATEPENISPAEYTCEPWEDIRLLFKWKPQNQYILNPWTHHSHSWQK